MRLHTEQLRKYTTQSVFGGQTYENPETSQRINCHYARYSRNMCTWKDTKERHFHTVDVGTMCRSKYVTRVSIVWNILSLTAVGSVTWIMAVGTKRTNQHAKIRTRLSVTLHCTYMYVDITHMVLEHGCVTDNIRANVFMGTAIMCRQRRQFKEGIWRRRPKTTARDYCNFFFWEGGTENIQKYSGWELRR
jgi:hypothetical protein